jgi:glycosyltransferase involved in cell wall biosynthesis
MVSIILNGKFLSAAPTGVHRVAAELGNALADLKAEGHPLVGALDIAVWAPKSGEERARSMRLPVHILGPFTGIPWEQLTLPLRKGRRVVLSLCNVGPALCRGAITMIHDAQVHISPASYARPFRLWYHFIQPLFARRHRLILTVSEFSRQEIANARLCRIEKIEVVHNGVDHMLRETSDRSAVERLELDRRSYVLGLSTTQAHKNIPVLLAAFSNPVLDGLKLVLFGGTKREDFVAAGYEVPENVIFAGRVTDGELRGLMEDALCLAFPSTTEGFGLPPLEAMILGCPAVIAPCGALPEVCGDAALTASPDRPEEWVNALTALKSDTGLWSRMSAAGRAQASLYTWRASALTLAALLTR